MSFKIAYCAGHYLGTAGKRIPASLDKNQTCEWTLNDRVADHFATAALEYEGVELLRTDDPSGTHFIDIPERTAKANKWGADIYLDIHHNAAGRVFSGGGVEAYSYPKSAEGKLYRDAIYNAVIEAGGLRGNRARPLQEKKFDSLTLTKMTAVLVEYGFMDSKTDAPIILTDLYAKKVAYGTMEGIAKVAGLKKKPVAQEKPVEYTLKLRQLFKGCEGDDVRALQILLNGRGHNCGDADGVFGEKTGNAVEAFQRKHGLTPDRIVGANTMARLLGDK